VSGAGRREAPGSLPDPGARSDRFGALTPVALDDLTAELAASLGDRVERGAPAGPLTTYRVGGPIGVLVRAAEPRDLEVVATAVRRHDPPLLVIGKGSNLLVADSGFAGLAVVLDGRFARLDTGGEGATVVAGGAVPLPVLARRSASAGKGGLEFYVGIPGTVGGAVRMNAGGHGRETREVLARAWVADLRGDGVARPFDGGALELGYRRSRLGPAEVVTEAELLTEACPPATCEARLAEIVRWRRDNQPGGANAGSVFRNPPGASAGRLIDACGLKGLRRGGAFVSPKHANFVQADAGATSADVLAVVRAVRHLVADVTGVELEPELRLVGFASGGLDGPGLDGPGLDGPGLGGEDARGEVAGS